MSHRSVRSERHLVAVLLELPLPVVQRAHLSGFEPAGNTVKVEGMVTNAPGHSTFLAGGGRLIRLTLDTVVHDVITADGTVVDHNIPRPQGNSIPFLHLKSLLICTFLSGRGRW